ncbi:MAG: hypothetical protein J3K34DRAFT_482842 [Monoraphidium minutum]|nr:MAG: hypothetical protein J3K34DRAFT_482842 [Monoraphidium minutum]
MAQRSLLDPQAAQVLESVVASLGCDGTRAAARLAHPLLRAAVDSALTSLVFDCGEAMGFGDVFPPGFPYYDDLKISKLTLQSRAKQYDYKISTPISSRTCVLRRSAALPQWVCPFLPTLAEFKYACAEPIAICTALPLLANALGRGLRRLTLNCCLPPEDNAAAEGASRSLVLFERLEVLSLRMVDPEGYGYWWWKREQITPGALRGLVGPLLAPAGAPGAVSPWAPPALREAVIWLPAYYFAGRLGACCQQLAAAARPLLRFEPFGQGIPSHTLSDNEPSSEGGLSNEETSEDGMMYAQRSLFDLPETSVLDAIVASLGCAGTRAAARLAHPLLRAAVDRTLTSLVLGGKPAVEEACGGAQQEDPWSWSDYEPGCPGGTASAIDYRDKGSDLPAALVTEVSRLCPALEEVEGLGFDSAQQCLDAILPAACSLRRVALAGGGATDGTDYGYQARECALPALAALTCLRLHICCKYGNDTQPSSPPDDAARQTGLLGRALSACRGLVDLTLQLDCGTAALLLGAVRRPFNHDGPDSGSGISEHAPRLRALMLLSSSDHWEEPSAAACRKLTELRVCWDGGDDDSDTCDDSEPPLVFDPDLACMSRVRKLVLQDRPGGRVDYSAPTSQPAARAAGMQQRWVRPLAHALTEFEYACAEPLPLQVALPLLAAELGPALRRLSLGSCAPPRVAAEAGVACRSLVMFERLKALSLRFQDPGTHTPWEDRLTPDALSALLAPLLAPGAPPALREAVIWLPARHVGADLSACCTALTAAARPRLRLRLRFELFGKGCPGEGVWPAEGVRRGRR